MLLAPLHVLVNSTNFSCRKEPWRWSDNTWWPNIDDLLYSVIVQHTLYTLSYIHVHNIYLHSLHPTFLVKAIPLYLCGCKVDVDYSRNQREQWRDRHQDSRDWVCFKVHCTVHVHVFMNDSYKHTQAYMYMLCACTCTCIYMSESMYNVYMEIHVFSTLAHV